MSRFARLLVLVAGLAFFVALVLQAGVRELAATLERTGWAFLLLIVVWGVVYICNTIAWNSLIGASAPRQGRPEPPARIPFLYAYAITVASFAINYATPFVALGGEPLKIAQSADWIGVDRAASSVISFRVTHTLGQVLFWLIAVPIGWILLPPTPAARLGLLTAGAVLFVAACLLILLFRHGFVVRALNALRHIPVLRRLAPRLERFRPTLEHVDSQLAVLTDSERSRLVAAVFLEILGRSIAMIEYVIIARIEGLHISYPQAYLIGAVAQLTIIILIFVPLELGSREGGTRLGYTLLHLSPALGVYAGVITHLRELTWIGIGLAIAWGLQQKARD